MGGSQGAARWLEPAELHPGLGPLLDFRTAFKHNPSPAQRLDVGLVAGAANVLVGEDVFPPEIGRIHSPGPARCPDAGPVALLTRPDRKK